MRRNAIRTCLTIAVLSACTYPAAASAADNGPSSDRVAAGYGGNVKGMSPNGNVTQLQAPSANQKAAFDYFVRKGLTKTQSAGVVGNLMQESGVNPASVQSGGGAGRGIAQWSVGGRWDKYAKDNMKWFAASRGASTLSLTAQLDFTWYELTTFKNYGLAQLKSATSINSAVTAFESKFEGCGTCHHSTRVTYAQQVYNKYAGSAPSQPVFAVSPSSSRSNIKALQHLLTAYDIPTQTDGSYGPGTTTSVKTYQGKNNLTRDGSAGPATMAKMTGSPNVRVTTGWPNHNTAKAAQELLHKAGYNTPVDGTFDTTDTTNVKTFQTKNNLPATGIIDATTWSRLFTA